MYPHILIPDDASLLIVCPHIPPPCLSSFPLLAVPEGFVDGLKGQLWQLLEKRSRIDSTWPQRRPRCETTGSATRIVPYLWQHHSLTHIFTFRSYIYIFTYIYLHTYIYISVYIHLCIYLLFTVIMQYLYIYIYRQIDRQIDRIVILFFIWQHILYNPIKCPTRVYPDKLLKLREDDRSKENRSYQQNQNCEL